MTTKVRGDLPQPPARLHLRSEAAPAPIATTTDGRNLDGALARVYGEAGGLVGGPRKSPRAERAPDAAEESESTTYYGQPILKAPVWKAFIPAYLFFGGAAGGALALGAAAELVGGTRMRSIVMPARVLGTACVATGAALLVADLGRPSRFLNMLRVFRPTSPMNLGTWILSAAGATAAASVVLPRLGMRRLATAAGAVAGLAGLGLGSYTAVLLANTAVPTWQHGARTLPPLFVASAASSATAALDLVPATAPAARALATFGSVARAAELVAAGAYERALTRRGISVSRHLRRGRAGRLLRAAQALTLASLVTSLAGWRRTSGILGLGGAAAMRFAVMEAGRASARDPRATFEPQRTTAAASLSG